MVAHPTKAIPQALEEAWDAFINVLKRHVGCIPGENPDSELGGAHNAFWKEYCNQRDLALLQTPVSFRI